MLIACGAPFLVLFHSGYIRLSIHKYYLNDHNLTIHLTNQYIQKKDPAYEDVKDDTIWSMQKFNDYINDKCAEEKQIPKNWAKTILEREMQKIMLHVFQSVKSKLCARLGFFELYGFDFMVDEDMKIWLIEVNVNPAMHTNCLLLQNILPPMIAETVDIAVECFDKARRGKDVMPLQSCRKFVPIYEEDPTSSFGRHNSANARGNISYWIPPRFSPHPPTPTMLRAQQPPSQLQGHSHEVAAHSTTTSTSEVVTLSTFIHQRQLLSIPGAATAPPTGSSGGSGPYKKKQPQWNFSTAAATIPMGPVVASAAATGSSSPLSPAGLPMVKYGLLSPSSSSGTRLAAMSQLNLLSSISPSAPPPVPTSSVRGTSPVIFRKTHDDKLTQIRKIVSMDFSG